MNCHSILLLVTCVGIFTFASNRSYSIAQEPHSNAISDSPSKSIQGKNPYQVSFADFEWQLRDSAPLFDGRGGIGEKVPTEKAIDLFLKRIKEDPQDYASRTILGELYLRQATEDDNLASYGLAMDALRDALKINANHKPAKFGMAKVLIAQHQFADAISLLLKSIPDESQSPADLALIVDCHLDMGDLAKAKVALNRLAMLEDSPPIVARQARLAELTGHQDEAVELMESALRVVRLGSADPTEWHWYQWRLAGLAFDMGDLPKAHSYVQEILKVDPSDERSTILLAKIQFAKGNPNETLDLLTDLVTSHPSPPTLSMLGDLHETLGDSKSAAKYLDQAEEVVREEALIAKAAHAREAAVFFADHDRHLNEALELIQIDCKQRQDLYTRDAHAWILFKNNRLQEAKAKCVSLTELGAKDLSCLYHATKIHQALGENAIAKTYLQKIINVNPAFSIRYSADVARLQATWEMQPER